MKGIWRTNPVGDALWPPWKKMHDLGVTDFYVPSWYLDKSTGKYVRNVMECANPYASGVISQGFGFRQYSDPRWRAYLDGVSYGKDCGFEKRAVTGTSGYMMDIEYHDAEFVRTAILAYRTVVPSGPLAWTLEPHQGGWFTPELVKVINEDINFVVVPQNFYYNMTPYDLKPGQPDLRNDLIDQGIRPARVKVFYDGAKSIPGNWDGCILSEERI